MGQTLLLKCVSDFGGLSVFLYERGRALESLEAEAMWTKKPVGKNPTLWP